jgi:hypothetical protein
MGNPVSFPRRHERLLCAIIGLLLLALTVARWAGAWQSASFVDLKFFVATAEFVVRHVSPYSSDEFAALEYPAKPIQAPSMTALMMPIVYLPDLAQKVLFFFGGAAAFVAGLFLAYRHYGLGGPRELLLPRWQNLPLWAVSALLFQSSALLMMLRHGQLSSVVMLLLMLVLLFPERDGRNTVFLGLAAALKFPLLILVAPVLLLQKRWRMGMGAFALFLGLVLLPGLWLDGLLDSFSEYLRMVLEDMKGGANSYAHGSSFSMIQFDFWRCGWCNTVGKLTMLGLLALVLARSRRRIRGGQEGWLPLHLGAAEIGLLMTVTLLTAYHRTYDCVVFLPFLAVVFLSNIRHWPTAITAGGFLLFAAVPSSLVYRVSEQLGLWFPAGRQLFHYSSYRIMDLSSMFPLENIVLAAMVGFWVFWAWRDDPRARV